MIADEVKEILPGNVIKTYTLAVSHPNDVGTERKMTGQVEFETINYTAMIPILIGAVKEEQQIDQLTKLVIDLRGVKGPMK